MSDERTRRGNDTPRRVPVSDPAQAESAERFFQNSFFVVVSAIGRLERGYEGESRPPTIRKLAEALGVDPHELLVDDA